MQYKLVILMVMLSFAWRSECDSVDINIYHRLEEMEKKLAAQDVTLKQSTTSLENRVRDLEAQLERTNKSTLPFGIDTRGLRSLTTVAFTAYVDHSDNHIGLEQPIPYNNIITNIGNGFNRHTHIFTCPVTGLYMFTFTICNEDLNHLIAKLVVDNQNIVDAVSQPTVLHAEIQGSNTALIQVSQGQSVWVAVYYEGGVTIHSDDTYRFASFSGFLIQTM